MKNDTNTTIKSCLNESIRLKYDILNSNLINQISDVALTVAKILDHGGRIFFAGNGGSFADSQHLAAEFISKFLYDRNPLPAIALGTNNSSISAIGNDYKFQDIFSRELNALGSFKDIFIPISTSGESKNLIEAINVANAKGMKVVSFTGSSGGAFNDLCECIKIPSNNVPRIQECHIFVGHLICQITEELIFNPDKQINEK